MATSRDRLRAGRTILAIGALAAALGVPGPPDAEAKVTCQQRGLQDGDAEVSGLPDAPVAAEDYELTVAVGTADAIREVPQLAVVSCPAGHRADYEWLRATPTDDPETFTVEIRFPKPGRYAMSVFDRSGQFHDAGLHRVGTAPVGAGDSVASSAGAPTFATPAWIAIAGLAAATGVTYAARRRRCLR